MESARRALSKDVRRTCRTRKDGTETWAGNLVSRRGRRHPAPGRPFNTPATMPPEAQQPPGPAADPPQPQHITHHHHGSRGRHHLRRSCWLCGHHPRSLSTAAPPRAACSLTSPSRTASSSPRQGSPSTTLLPPSSTQHPKFGAVQHAGMAASRRRSSYAGNCCLPMQLYDERRKPAPGLAF